MSTKQTEKPAVLYLRNFPRELKKRLVHAAVDAGKDLKDFVPMILAAHLDAADKSKRTIKKVGA